MFRQNKISICFLNTVNQPEWISGDHTRMEDGWLVFDLAKGRTIKYAPHRIIAIEHTQEGDQNESS